jgi:molecular chaperone DnaK
MVVQRLKDAAEQAKIELSNVMETTINLPFLTADASGPKHLQKQLTRAKLEQMIRPLVDRSLEPLKKALSDAKKTPQQIHEVVLVGGSTRIPLVYETVKKFFGKMIARNTTIPTQKKEVFSTATDSQPSVEVHVLQGERTEARYNRTLGRFHLEGIMPAPRGVPKIEVTFDIDANGILSVHAKDMATGKDQRITITASGGLKEEEIQKMVNEAAANEAEDKKRREEIERRNKLDNLCYTLEKTINENKEKLPESDVTSLTGIIAEGRAAIEKQDDAGVSAALEKLEKEAHRIASVMYDKAGPQGGAPPPGADGGGAPPPQGGGGKPKDGVIDAEFEESN